MKTLLALLLLIPSLICLTPRLTPGCKRNKKVLIIGAGEGIRTLDFNLGNDVIEAPSNTLTLRLLGF